MFKSALVYLKKVAYFLTVSMSLLFINKTSGLSNLKTRTAMNAKITVFVICVEAIYVCYYIICMTVTLSVMILKKEQV